MKLTCDDTLGTICLVPQEEIKRLVLFIKAEVSFGKVVHVSKLHSKIL